MSDNIEEMSAMRCSILRDVVTSADEYCVMEALLKVTFSLSNRDEDDSDVSCADASASAPPDSFSFACSILDDIDDEDDDDDDDEDDCRSRLPMGV
jgi:hypothetical protein